jgi:cytochrome d ubiquinol oxidase subunit II
VETLWFCLVALMLAVYVVLDGFDLGAGIAHLIVARCDQERRAVVRSIGPVWDGNEVWLLAAAGTLFFAFPALYATAFSGFYLPLMMVLWLLMLRAIALEFRAHLQGVIWRPLCDGVFAVASALLAIFFGAALGNVVRGVPLGRDGRFFEALWTNWQPGPDPGILDWFTVSVGLAALAALAMHGALWIAYRTEGPTQRRARALARRSWWAVLTLTVLVTLATFQIQPQVPHRLAQAPWGAIFIALALGGLVAVSRFGRRGDDRGAFLGSCAYLLGMLTSAAHGLYPYVLPSAIDPAFGLTVHSAAAPQHGLRIGLMWWIPGMALATLYFVYVYRRFAGKVSDTGEGY